jgi:hypothetical protein
MYDIALFAAIGIVTISFRSPLGKKIRGGFRGESTCLGGALIYIYSPLM